MVLVRGLFLASTPILLVGAFGALLSFYTLTCQKASFYDLQLFISGLALNLVGLGNSDQKDIFYGRFSELQLSDSLERLGILTSAGSPTADKR